jgi:hypothetical protein
MCHPATTMPSSSRKDQAGLVLAGPFRYTPSLVTRFNRPPTMLKLFRLLAPYRRSVAIVLVLAMAQSIGFLLLPRLMSDIVDKGIVRGDQGAILRTGGLMLLMSIVATLCAIAGAYYSAQVARVALLDPSVRPLRRGLARHADDERHDAGAADAHHDADHGDHCADDGDRRSDPRAVAGHAAGMGAHRGDAGDGARLRPDPARRTAAVAGHAGQDRSSEPRPR